MGNYAELQALWTKQRETGQEWQFGLVRAANQLRNEVEKQLGLPNLTYRVSPDKNSIRRYVDLKDMANPSAINVADLSHRSITEDEELPFGIVVTMEHGPDYYPKQSFYVPVAVRFKNHHPELAFWNTETNSPDSRVSWETSVAKFALAVIDILRTKLSYDPFTGASSKPSMGFVQE